MSASVTGKTWDLAILRRMLSLALPYKLRFVSTTVLIFALSILGPLRPVIVLRMVNGPIAEGDYKGLLNWTIVILLLLVLESVLQFYQTYSANTLGQNIIRDMRISLFTRFTGFKLKYFDRTPIGRIVTRAVSDIETVAEAFSSGILTILGDLLKLFIVVGLMFSISWKMTLVVMIPIPVLLFATRIFKKAIEKAFKKVRSQVSKLNTFVQEHIQGMSIVQVFGREKEEQRRFRVINAEHRKAHIDSVWAYSIFFPIVEILSSASIALLILLLLSEVGSGQEIDKDLPGQMIGFIMLIQMLYRPIRQLADRFNVLQMGMVGCERVFEVMDTEAQLQVDNHNTDIVLKGNVKFEKVWLAYEGDEYVLKDINLDVKQGETVAFVGSTGAGKSSIINLIGRFYEFQRGSITIEGEDIRNIDPEHLREHISVVQQDVYLYSDSIINNIGLHNPEISESDIIAASKKIGAHDFIIALPGGYHYNVAERGRMLSVGQRQLISFIRAYVHQPDILILDEATSSIDSESEELIQRAQETLTEGRTSFVIAHRLSTIQNADMIHVLDKGRIVESGNHEDLIALDGRYMQLYSLQFG
jgi:ATP-binding cassette subfamily B multidrug efflux pump